MILANILYESERMAPINIIEKTSIIEELTPSKVDDKRNSISPIKIPLVSNESILATSPNFILVNECTKRRNQFVLYNENLQKFSMRNYLTTPVIDALWYDEKQQFFLLTSEDIFTLDPVKMSIEKLLDLIPMDKKEFKCFTLLNQSTLLIAYNEWSAENMDKWRENPNTGYWELIERKSLKLTNNEIIGNISSSLENIVISIYNYLTEEWRIEIRNADTFQCIKSSLLNVEKNVFYDYRVMPIKCAESDIKYLAYSPTNSNIIAIDTRWKNTILNYKNPVQRMALFRENLLIVRTTERIDVHMFL